MSDDADLEEFKAQAQKGGRVSAQTKQDDGDLTDAFVDALKAVESGDVHPNVSVCDAHTAALLHTLGNDPEAMHDTVDSLRDYLGGNADGEADKSVLIRPLLRAGLRIGAPDTRESLADATVERTSNEIRNRVTGILRIELLIHFRFCSIVEVRTAWSCSSSVAAISQNGSPLLIERIWNHICL